MNQQSADCYDLPEYWDLAFSEDTSLEADFVFGAVEKYCDFNLKSAFEPGCGGGRLLVELAKRGVEVLGSDLSTDAVAYANRQLQHLPGQAIQADMQHPVAERQFDAAYCFVNTFRHLLTEEAARQHLKSVAQMLRPGGLYLIGLHLFPPDADEEDEEEWTATTDRFDILMQLEVKDCSRKTRRESLDFTMRVTERETGQVQQFRSAYPMRLYSANQMKSLLDSVPELERLDVYDFWYDLSEPLSLNDELGDTVLVLRRTT